MVIENSGSGNYVTNSPEFSKGQFLKTGNIINRIVHNAAAGVILQRGEKFLLQLRDNKEGISNPGMWGLFGGGIEKGESPEDAAVREIREELGINLDRKNLRLLFDGVFEEQKGYVFLCKVNYKKEELTLMEGSDMEYFTKDEIMSMENLAPIVKEVFSRLSVHN